MILNFSKKSINNTKVSQIAPIVPSFQTCAILDFALKGIKCTYEKTLIALINYYSSSTSLHLNFFKKLPSPSLTRRSSLSTLPTPFSSSHHPWNQKSILISNLHYKIHSLQNSQLSSSSYIHFLSS